MRTIGKADSKLRIGKKKVDLNVAKHLASVRTVLAEETALSESYSNASAGAGGRRSGGGTTSRRTGAKTHRS